MRRVLAVLLPAAMVATVLAGCSTAAPESSDSAVPTTSALPPLATHGSGQPNASASPSPGAAGPGAWSQVSTGLTRPGAQVTFDAARDGQTVVASVLTEDTPGDYDAGIVYSLDDGASWAWGGVVAGPGRTFPEGIMLDGSTAIIVGSTQDGEGDTANSTPFMARAEAPAFALTSVKLPKTFDVPGVRLHSIVSADGEWIVAGYGIRVAGDKALPIGYLWRSSDQGATWSRSKVTVPGLRGIAVKQIAVAPDGSWNLIGDGTSGDAITQFDAVWLRTVDQGRTFTQVSPKAFSAPFDQGASSISFSAEGKAAIVGTEEVTDEHGASVSALWLSVPGHGVKRMGSPRISVKDETPPGEFLDGVVWDGEEPVAWGSTSGDYPMDDVQLWNLESAKLVPSGQIPGDGTPLAVATMLPGADDWLALGLVGDLDQADIGVWRASAE
jgi:hypothetical protein